MSHHGVTAWYKTSLSRQQSAVITTLRQNGTRRDQLTLSSELLDMNDSWNNAGVRKCCLKTVVETIAVEVRGGLEPAGSRRVVRTRSSTDVVLSELKPPGPGLLHALHFPRNKRCLDSPSVLARLGPRTSLWPRSRARSERLCFLSHGLFSCRQPKRLVLLRLSRACLRFASGLLQSGVAAEAQSKQSSLSRTNLI